VHTEGGEWDLREESIDRGMYGKGRIDFLGTIEGRERSDTGMIDEMIGGIAIGMREGKGTIGGEIVKMSVSANPVVIESITVTDEKGIEMTGIVNQREGG